MQSETQIDEEIKKTEERNKYLRAQLAEMKMTMDKIENNVEEQPADLRQQKIVKQLETVEKNIRIAQKQLSKLSGKLNFDEALLEIDKLGSTLKQREEQKKSLQNKIAQLKKDMYLKQRKLLTSRNINPKVKIQEYQKDIQVLMKKIEHRETYKKMPIDFEKIQKSKSLRKFSMQETPEDVSPELREELALYKNITTKYEKEIKTLTEEITQLSDKEKQRGLELKRIDDQIGRYKEKIEELKKGISHNNYKHRKVVTERKLIRIN